MIHMITEHLFRTYCLVFFAALVACFPASTLKGSEQGKASGSNSPQVRIKSIEPTIFFVKKDDSLLQVVDIEVENGSEPIEAVLDVTLGPKKWSTVLGKAKKGKTVFQTQIPDIVIPTQIEFVLKVGEKEQDRHKATWQPGRHWEVCMVPITHHDLGYTDTLENVLRKYDGFYDDIIKFCDQTKDWPAASKFRYTVEASWSIQHFIENRPKEVVDKLARYIKDGRIELGAFFGNQISALCSHEELIRLMYPSFAMKREFGGSIRTASITDIPGLSWGLPTVMAGSGVKYFFAGMPTYFSWGRTVHGFWDESAILRHGRPDAFRWEGPDGGSVLVYYQGGYGHLTNGRGPNSFQEVFDALPDRLEQMQKQGSPFSVARYIHRGVDNYPPELQISHIARKWNDRWAYPKLIVATNTMFFERLEKQCKDVPVFRGELPSTDYALGATSTAKETAVNRLAHDKLHSAEKFATIAHLLADYPALPDKRAFHITKHGYYPNLTKTIGEAYENMLLYDEHTWGMEYPLGKLQDWNWSDKSHYAYKAAGLAESILGGAIDGLAEKVNLDKKGKHVVVFNSLSAQRTDLVRVPAKGYGFGHYNNFTDKPLKLIDTQTGQVVPSQLVKLDSPRAPVPYAAGRYARGQFNPRELFELVFLAEDVPSLGWKTYRLAETEKAVSFKSSIVPGDNSLENRFYKIKLDPNSGTIESIYDKELAREIVDKESPHKLNQLVVRWSKSGKQESPLKAYISKGQSGPIYDSLVVSTSASGCPQVTQEIILYENIKRIDLANRILKDSTPTMELYFAFPFRIDNPDFRFEGSCSVIKPFRDQFPGSNTNYYSAGHWAYAGDGQIGVTLAPIESHMLEFGGLWPCYVSQAHHGATPPDYGNPFVKAEDVKKGHMYSFVLNSNFRTNFASTQQGNLLFRYSITTHKGDWRKGRAHDFGWSAGNPLLPVMANGPSSGPLQEKNSFCLVDHPNVMLMTLKQAEDGDGIILRLLETEGKQVTAKVSLPHLTINKAYRTNLMEENLSELTSAPHEVTIPVGAFGITTIRLNSPWKKSND